MIENEEILTYALKTALNEGIEEIILRRNIGKNYQIRFSNSAIDISKIWNKDVLEIFLAKDQRTTQIDIETPTPKTIKKIIENTANYLNKLPKNNLYGGMETQQHSYHTIKGLFDKRISEFSEKAPEYINSAIEAGLSEKIHKIAGVLYFGFSNTSLLTSHEIKGAYDSSYYRLTIRAFADNESSGQGMSCGRNLSDIENKFIRTAKHASDIASMALGGVQGKAGTYDLIMSPTVAANIFGQLTNAAQPLLMMIGMSPIKTDDLGKKIASENLTICDDALIEEGLNNHPFDVEGTPSAKITIIENGTLKGILQNTSTAKQFDAETTGSSDFYSIGMGSKFLAPSPSNMIYQAGDYTFDEMIEESKKPTIYVTSNWYTRFTNMLEGSFSTIPRDGIFLIENGKIVKSIRKIRISDNLLGMFNRIEAIGKKVIQINWWEVPTPTFIPAFKIKNVNISAATQ